MFVTRALGASAALLMAVPVSACTGGGSGPPHDASVEDFCDAYFHLFSRGMRDIDPAAPQREQETAMVAALHAWAEEIEALGTPVEMPDEAREGFELVVGAATDVEPGAVDNLAEVDDDFSEDELAATRAFEEYATQACESPFGDPPTA